MSTMNLSSGTPMWSGLLAPVAAHVVGDVCPKQARVGVEGIGTSARFDIVPTGAFGAVTVPRPGGPPV